MKRFVKIADRDRLLKQEQRGISKSFATIADPRKASPDPSIVDDLGMHGDEVSLMSLERRAADLPLASTCTSLP
ncbi:hypothetical protein P7D22_08100 [Lichenihabitans sp. Uapishka_5]|uniref:hypothetical protein n=1 Tax=Lichenihabitans sp. Uapishka_5 TaxID=3037302 RepID=UPI0029E7F9D2|nr:hypothetical protein [Lichenihabitans sp. Uapishka_5]MDX7951141.1 hypothetical protein [Lichenihabitans sp. Uapishka_5]